MADIRGDDFESIFKYSHRVTGWRGRRIRRSRFGDLTGGHSFGNRSARISNHGEDHRGDLQPRLSLLLLLGKRAALSQGLQLSTRRRDAGTLRRAAHPSDARRDRQLFLARRRADPARCRFFPQSGRSAKKISARDQEDHQWHPDQRHDDRRRMV